MCSAKVARAFDRPARLWPPSAFARPAMCSAKVARIHPSTHVFDQRPRIIHAPTQPLNRLAHGSIATPCIAEKRGQL
jgi:hypothetical protein